MSTLIVPRSAKKVPDWVEKAMPTPNFTPDATSTDPETVLKSNLVKLGDCDTPEQQKAMIFEMLGPNYLKRLRSLGPRLLVATYVWPQRRKVKNAAGEVVGHIQLPPSKLNSNRYEGKTGLVIAMGKVAFKYSGQFEWEDDKPSVGDWIWYTASDAPERGFCGVFCRMIFDHLVEGIAEFPTDVW